MEGAKHQRKSTTSSVGSAGLSPQAGGSGRGIAAGRAASRTSGGMATAASAMLRDERTAQNKKPKYMTSWGMKRKNSNVYKNRARIAMLGRIRY